ncbi:hypothetical protein F5146DRAFT_1063179 [Armillaria mellea]|nr:hypothetical protein F5146DRAFT_1063179 [Armillaria mellea]
MTCNSSILGLCLLVSFLRYRPPLILPFAFSKMEVTPLPIPREFDEGKTYALCPHWRRINVSRAGYCIKNA